MARLAPGLEDDHFEEREHAQRRRAPNLGQQLGDGFDVGHRRGAGADQHVRPAQPRPGEIRIAPTGFGEGDELEPIGEDPGREELARHVGVIQVAVGVDQARQEEDVAQIQRRRAAMPGQVRPAANGAEAMAGNQDGAVRDGGPGHREDEARAQEKLAGGRGRHFSRATAQRSFSWRLRLLREATLCLRALYLL